MSSSKTYLAFQNKLVPAQGKLLVGGSISKKFVSGQGVPPILLKKGSDLSNLMGKLMIGNKSQTLLRDGVKRVIPKKTIKFLV